MAGIIQTDLPLDSSSSVNAECILPGPEQHSRSYQRLLTISRWIESKTSIVLSVIWLTALAVLQLIPASIWFDAKSLRISDAIVGTSPSVALTREINLDFIAIWQVTIHDVTTGKPQAACVSMNKQKYYSTAILPDNLDLNWLTLGRCGTPEKGRYMVTINYEVVTPWFMPNKHDEVVSNIFTIQ